MLATLGLGSHKFMTKSAHVNLSTCQLVNSSTYYSNLSSFAFFGGRSIMNSSESSPSDKRWDHCGVSLTNCRPCRPFQAEVRKEPTNDKRGNKRRWDALIGFILHASTSIIHTYLGRYHSEECVEDWKLSTKEALVSMMSRHKQSGDVRSTSAEHHFYYKSAEKSWLTVHTMLFWMGVWGWGTEDQRIEDEIMRSSCDVIWVR